jgi:hypothetical protein
MEHLTLEDPADRILPRILFFFVRICRSWMDQNDEVVGRVQLREIKQVKDATCRGLCCASS